MPVMTAVRISRKAVKMLGGNGRRGSHEKYKTIYNRKLIAKATNS